jgi:hypothetical protein
MEELVTTSSESEAIVTAPSPLVGEGNSDSQQGMTGEGASSFKVPATKKPPLPSYFVGILAPPSPTIRAVTPVFDVLWGEGTNNGIAQA